MPSPQAILNATAAIANDWRVLAIGWHAAFGALLAALILGWRPSNRLAGALLVAPLVSVGALAWASGNPFNGTAFLVAAIVLLVVAERATIEPVAIAPLLLLLPGAVLIGYGWVYPHFLRTESWMEYLYAAPFGLVPCPTLSAVIGLSLVLDLPRVRPWGYTVAAIGVIYGVIGIFRLGVALDYGLLGGALVLAAATVTAPRRPVRVDRLAAVTA